MNFNDLKIWVLNTFTIAFTFTNAESFLKIFLLIISIGYTIDRWMKLRKK